MKPRWGRPRAAPAVSGEAIAVLLTDVPDELFGRGIAPVQEAHGFRITLDRAEPWGGGSVAGRVEVREQRDDNRALTASVVLLAAWLDVAPQLVGKKPFFRPETYWDLRTRFPVWLDETAWTGSQDLGALSGVNWLPFAIGLPPELPRALEGTFVSFRYRVEARRRRRLGHETASLPLILAEQRTLPTVRVETGPIGSWRLLELRAEAEIGGSAGPCSVQYEPRRPEDMPEE